MKIREWLQPVSDPHEFFHRVVNRLSQRELEKRKEALDLDEERKKSIDFLSKHFSCESEAFFEELRTSAFRKRFLENLDELKRRKGRPGSSSLFDCETLYATVRAAKPRVAVETGVLYGAFSAHILEAMKRNGCGKLISLDLPSQDRKDLPKDFLVPEDLKGGFRLVLGDTRETLRPTLEKEGPVDLFNHDSLHTFDHMMWEYLTAHSFLRPDGVLTSHDVLAPRFRASAFEVFTDGLGYVSGCFRNFGIAIRLSEKRNE